jgi:hypothetical protein
MKIKNHLRIFAIASLVWFVFLLAGMPDYYLQYSFITMLWFVILLLIPITWIMFLVLKQLAVDRQIKIAVWFALYFTIPLFLYDYIYCGIYLGYGLEFLFTFWFLSIYYIIPWILFPVIAVLLNILNRRVVQNG